MTRCVDQKPLQKKWKCRQKKMMDPIDVGPPSETSGPWVNAMLTAKKAMFPYREIQNAEFREFVEEHECYRRGFFWRRLTWICVIRSVISAGCKTMSILRTIDYVRYALRMLRSYLDQ